jgi:hypothetical protein
MIARISRRPSEVRERADCPPCRRRNARVTREASSGTRVYPSRIAKSLRDVLIRDINDANLWVETGGRRETL